MVVTGIPGVGKTTVLDELQNLAKQNNFNLVVLNFGTVMNEEMRELGKDLHRDDIRRQNIDMQRKAQELAASKIAKQSEKGTTIVDTHMFIRTSSGLWAGLPENVLTILNPGLLVLVEADPEQIAARRRGDTDRRREHGIAEDITFDLEWSRATAAASAVATGAPVKVIRNDTGRQRQAAQELFQAIRSVMEN